MASLTVQQIFQNTTTPTFNGTGVIARTPFTFTSTARLLKSGKIKGLGNDLNAIVAQSNITQQLQNIEQEAAGFTATGLSLLGTAIHSTGTTATATGAILAPLALATPKGSQLPIISMAVNPTSIKWTQPKRYTKRDTQEGSVFFHFTNTADQNNDILTCQFTGQTGNIRTTDLASAVITGANQKLQVWHELYNLTREGLLLNTENSGTNYGSAIRNEFFIVYKTALMIVPITLIGFFSQVLEFTESATEPFNREYSFSFTVTNTSPKLDAIAGLLTTGLVTNAFLGSTNTIVGR